MIIKVKSEMTLLYLNKSSYTSFTFTIIERTQVVSHESGRRFKFLQQPQDYS